MNESILINIKKLLGLPEEYTTYDTDVILCINSVFSILYQLGVGPDSGFKINDDSAEWSDFIGDTNKLEDVKTYVFLKTKLMFDPPTAGPMIDAIKTQISELEWRINVAVDPGDEEE